MTTIPLSSICQCAAAKAKQYSLTQICQIATITGDGRIEPGTLFGGCEIPKAFRAAATWLEEISLGFGNPEGVSQALSMALMAYLMGAMRSGQCSVLTPAVVQLHKGACGHYGGNLASCIYAALTFTEADELYLPDFILKNGWRMVIDPQAALFAKERKNNTDYSLFVCATPSHDKWPERDAIVVASYLVDHLFFRSPRGCVLPSAENVQNFRQRVMEKVGTELWTDLTSPDPHTELVLSKCGHLAPWLLKALNDSGITEGYFPPQYLAARIYPNGQHNHRIKVYLDPNLPEGQPSAVIN